MADMQSAPDFGDRYSRLPAAVQPYFRAFRGAGPQPAIEAAKYLSKLQDRSLLPFLIQERDWIQQEFASYTDVSEARREDALTMAIVSLLASDERDRLRTEGTEFERWCARRCRNAASLDHYWGTLDKVPDHD